VIRPQQGLREARGHRHVGGSLGAGPLALGEHREQHYVAAAIAIVAAIASAYATYSASQAQAASADYQGKVAKQQATAAAEAAKVAEQNQREQDRRVQAAQRARIGATGAEETVGAPLLAEMESAANAELNARRIRWEGQTRVAGFQAEEVGQGFAARQYRRQGYVGAGATLLTGAAKAYGAYASAPSGSFDYSRGFGYSPGDNR
jgi:hypothetical protein